MDYNKIRALLELYWEGETSLEEEEMLRHFFVTHTAALPEDLREAAPLFRYFQAEKEQELPAWEIPRVAPLPGSRPWQHWMKYAAALLMMAGAGYSVQQYIVRHNELSAAAWQQDTYQDPEKAYQEAQKALELLSRNLNKGTEQMEKLAYFNEATDKIKRN
ncbi:hypothetical protein F0L74_07955 [Chitinophaga agrisoli]|uniref:Uncharacterized protein n=1 Tax=Chitinophaga agrisoli TaxID=2607653 RepID=A0A5B2VWS0_9BACT|nr:hypothetical protein [Chitinophaga agrisoli]KAA2242469.1 hypothetical protein F0L74_07955 [Chitinophaga agrisoli]